MKCSVCNAQSTSGAAYCQQCGAKLPASEAASDATSKPTKAADARDSGASFAAANTGRGRAPADIPEETLWEGTYSPKAMVGVFLLCGIVSVALLVGAFLLAENTVLSGAMLIAIPLLWVLAGVRLGTHRLGKSYRLTNQMFYHREGVMTRTTDRIELIEIHDVTWKQGLLQRMVDVGTVIISSADRTHGTLALVGIEKAEYVAGLIDKARRSEQLRRGRRIDFSNIDHQT